MLHGEYKTREPFLLDFATRCLPADVDNISDDHRPYILNLMWANCIDFFDGKPRTYSGEDIYEVVMQTHEQCEDLGFALYDEIDPGAAFQLTMEFIHLINQNIFECLLWERQQPPIH